MILDCVVDPAGTMADTLSIFTAVFREEIRHLLPHPGKPLAVSSRGDTQNVPGDTAVHPEHGSQYKDAAAFRVQALEHDVCAGQLQLLGQDCPLHILGQVGHVLDLPVADIVPVELKAQGELGEHVLFVVLEVVCRNAEYPGCESAFPLEGG